MAREPFKITPNDHGRVNIDTSAFPDRVSVDLDDKIPGNYTPIDPEDVQVVEVDDTARDARGNPQTDPATWGDDGAQDPKNGRTPNFQKRINRLKAETTAERDLRMASERREAAAIEAARVANAQVEDLRRRLDSTTSLAAKSMTGEREAKIQDATRRLEQAHAEGNSSAIAKATADMTTATAELAQIRANTPPPRTQQEQQPRPIEQPRQVQAPNLSPDTAEWIAHNRWFNTDVPRTQFAVSLHNTLETRGIKPGDPRYVQELDKGMKAMYDDHKPLPRNRADDFDDERGSAPRRSNAVEPGGREDSAARPNPNPRTVELTSSQLAIAKRLGVTPQQYAASLVDYNANRKGA